MKVVLINDTSMWNPHFGCQLVGQTFREQFARVGIDCVASLALGEDDLRANEELLAAADLVVINGEGSVHHGRNLHLTELPARYPAVFVNAVFQENPRCDGLSQARLVSVRDEASRRELKAQGIDAIVTPDAIFASALLRAFQKPQPTMDIGFTDNVVDPSSGFTVKVPFVADYLRTLCSYERLCIGRFHSAIAAAVLGIPFSTWPSNTHKIEELMAAIGVSHLHAQDLEGAEAICPLDFDPRISDFATSAARQVRDLFDRIAGLG